MKDFSLISGNYAGSNYQEIQAFRTELLEKPVRVRLTQSGYSAKSPTPWMIKVEGKLRRIYCTCYSNAASHWIIYDGQKVYVSIH